MSDIDAFIQPPQSRAIDGYQAARLIEGAWAKARERELRRLESLAAPDDAPYFREVALTRRRYATEVQISMDFLRSAKFDAEYEVALRVVRASVSGLIPALGGDTLIFPKSWRDHLKQELPHRLRRFCEWLLRRPLKIETERYEVTRFVGGLPEIKGDRLMFLDLFRRMEEE